MQGYLRDLDKQIREKKEREHREAQEELRLDQSMVRRNNGNWRNGHRGGGGGEPLRDEAGRMCAGVRGLFVNRELHSDASEPAVAVRHANPDGAAGRGVIYRPGSASSVGSSRNTRSSGGVARRDPNAGHRIFEPAHPLPGATLRRASSRGSLVVAHEVATSDTDGPVQPYCLPGCNSRGHEAASDQLHNAARVSPDSRRRQAHPQRWQNENGEDGEEHAAGSFPPVAAPQSKHDRVEVSSKWLEQLLLERDQLRRQLCEMGVAPRC